MHHLMRVLNCRSIVGFRSNVGILDRIISNMATRREIPWSGIIAEAVAIIAGILVAFAIDAWWDERNTQDWAAAQLLAIRDEFAQNLTALDEIVRTHDSNADKLEIIVNKIRKVEYGDKISASAAVWSALIAWRTADISTGTLEALLASGRLGDIDSLEIRQSLAIWPTQVENAQEDENLARDFAEYVVAPGLLGQGILYVAYRTRPIPGSLDEEPESDIETTVTATPELLDLATARMIHSRMASGSISELQDRIRHILVLVETELHGDSN